jgi:replicative DNA helicase
MQVSDHLQSATQVNEESNKVGNKKIIGLKGSGALNSDPDVIIILDRNFKEETENDSPEARLSLFLRKNRHGQTGKIDITFDKEIGQIKNKKYFQSYNNYYE